MENSKLLTILVEVDEGTKTPFKAPKSKQPQ